VELEATWSFSLLPHPARTAGNTIFDHKRQGFKERSQKCREKQLAYFFCFLPSFHLLALKVKRDKNNN
jgi:hypothetical protein